MLCIDNSVFRRLDPPIAPFKAWGPASPVIRENVFLGQRNRSKAFKTGFSV